LQAGCSSKLPVPTAVSFLLAGMKF